MEISLFNLEASMPLWRPSAFGWSFARREKAQNLGFGAEGQEPKPEPGTLKPEALVTVLREHS